jgi:hypothetical protein
MNGRRILDDIVKYNAGIQDSDSRIERVTRACPDCKKLFNIDNSAGKAEVSLCVLPKDKSQDGYQDAINGLGRC